MTPKRLFRTLAIAEAITWTLLISGLILRATIGLDIAVTIGGGIHGFVFLAYGATAVIVAVNQRWVVPEAATAIASAIVPYATIPVELWLGRSGRLDGEWRTEVGDDPRDRSPVNRLLRWFLARRVLLISIIAIGVTVVFVVLLILGPPGGRAS